MKTFTTYAEKKAKQFLNLLQGYTRGIRLTAILILLLMGVSNAWAVDFTGGKIYFRNDVTNWTTSNIQIFAHQSGYTWVSDPMNKVPDTKLYYINASCNWGGFVSYRICGNSSKWGSGGFTNQSSSSKYTGANNSYGLNGGSIYLITPYSANNGCTISPQWYSSNNDFLKYKATVKAKTSTDGSSYTDISSGNWPATITIQGTYLSGDGKTARSDVATNKGASGSYDAVATGLITMTYSSLNSEYAFVGWGTGNEPSSTSESYEYNIGQATTVYAFFKKKYTITFEANGHGTAPSSQTIIAGAKATEPAEPAEAGYTFGGWYKDEDCTNAFDFNTAITNNVTLYAKWTQNATYSLTVVAGAGIASVTGSEEPVTLGNTYPITATPKTGYTFSTWTANPVANATFESATTANTTVTVKNGSVTVTASATENMSTLTTSNQYDAGDPGYEVPEASVNSIGYETTATITATNDDAYTLTSWTLTNCTRTDGGADNATTITVRSNGDSKAATVIANYTKIPTETVYLINTGEWGTVKIYHWGGGSCASYPGENMTNTAEQIAGFDVYEYTMQEGTTPTGMLFNCGGDECKTGDLTWQNGKYYAYSKGVWYDTKAEAEAALAPDPLATDVYLAGDMNSWSTTANEFRKATGEATTASVTVNLTAGTHQFKLVINGTWKGNNGTMRRGGDSVHEGGWSFDSDGNCKIVADVAGDYTFTWNLTTNKLTVAYPPLPKYTVTATAENGTVEGDGEYEQGTEATLTATPNDGYVFVNWTEGGEVVSTETTYTFTVTKAVELVANFEKTYTITINAEANGSVSPRGDQQIGASGTSITATPDAGYRFVNWTVTGGATVANATNATTTVTATADGTVTAHFEEIPPKTIYLKPNDKWKTDNARFVAYVWNNTEEYFWFDMVDEDGLGYYTCTIPSKYTNLTFVRMDPSKPDNNWDNDWNQTGDLTIPLDDNNCFTLAENEEWDYATEAWSKYTPSAPYKVDDYRLVYIESEVLGEKPYAKFHPAHAITKQATGTKLDTVSFYINKTSGQNPAILLQQCTAINGDTITWQDVDIQYINGNSSDNPAAALAPAKKSAELYTGDGCTAVTENAVYNFILQQDNGTATILGEYTHPYVGNYYIRTNCADGGWSKYTDNLMTNSETALKHGKYDYYFCKWVANAGYNVRYTVANDYSHCVSDTLIGDTIASDGNLPAPANVRFTWNSSTNHLERAYISGATNASDRFLVLEGDANLKDADGEQFNVSGLDPHQAIFKDMNDWRYQVDVKVNDNTKIRLTAKYNKQIQYFKGSVDTTVGLITGAKNRLYKIRLIYDFKTNYLLSALIDSDPIEEDIVVDEVMIIREHQKLAQSLNVTTGSIDSIQNIYGVMTFHKDTLNNTEIPMMERALYWVSFPFDVHLEDAFGFGNYGEHWIMEYYDGQERAEKGGWIDATYWKYIENPSGVKLTKGVGYVLCLDLDKLKADSPIWGKATELSLYFPSLADNSTISKEAIEDVVVPAHECTINRPTPDGDRRIKDSNWNIIGVPSFANATDFDSDTVKFYYHWDAESNEYDAQIATEFNTMHAYMTQFAGTIKWTDKTIAPAAIAARKQSSGKDQYTLRLALQQEDTQCDHTFIRLQEDNATTEFDMNYDLCKIINSGANIYSMIDNVEVAANVLPVEERVIPIGLDIHETGNYTFAMPDGTDGITAILIDYETGTETNLLLADYTVELNAGIDNERFALRVRPNHVATEVENTILTDGNDNVKKYIIDGALYLLRDGKLYDAQGRMIQQ